MQMLIGGMDYIGQAFAHMVHRLYREGRKPGCLPFIEAAKRCDRIELVLGDGKPKTYIKG